MTNVQFYRLPDSMGSLFPVLVELLDLSLNKQLDTLILARDEVQATVLHKHLALRFNLGDTLTVSEKPSSRHSICWHMDAGSHQGMLINLTAFLPPWFSRFDHLAEVICGDEAFVAQKRQHYRLCKHRGYPLQYHDFTGSPQSATL